MYILVKELLTVSNKTSKVQGPPYVLGQAILPTTQYQVGILNCSWTQMKDISLYQKKIP